MKIVTTRAIDGSEIKIQFTDDVYNYIKSTAIVESKNGGQKTYKINNIVYTFDEELERNL
jgi:hypothetical protein